MTTTLDYWQDQLKQLEHRADQLSEEHPELEAKLTEVRGILGEASERLERIAAQNG